MSPNVDFPEEITSIKQRDRNIAPQVQYQETALSKEQHSNSDSGPAPLALGQNCDITAGAVLPNEEQHSNSVSGPTPPVLGVAPASASSDLHSLHVNFEVPQAQNDTPNSHYNSLEIMQEVTPTSSYSGASTSLWENSEHSMEQEATHISSPITHPTSPGTTPMAQEATHISSPITHPTSPGTTPMAQVTTPSSCSSSNNIMAQQATPSSGDSPMAQHDAIFSHDLPALISKFCGTPDETVLYEHFDHIADSLRFGRRPAIHIPQGLPYASESVPLEECDLIVADEKHAARILQGPLDVLNGKLLLIRNSSNEVLHPDSLASMISALDELVEVDKLHRNSSEEGIKVDIQDMKVKRGWRATKPRLLEEVVEELRDTTPWTPGGNPPLNILNIASKSRCLIDPPSLKACKELGILDRITNLHQNVKGRNVGKIIPFEFEACRNFQIFGQKLTSSLWHKDNMGFGTWVRCMFGKKVWPVMANMTDEEWEEFKERDSTWKPRDHTVPLIVLHPGDVLVMLPGNHNVHAPITLEDCCMEGGMFWDSRRMGPILEHIKVQLEYDNISNEEIPAGLKDILSYLRTLVKISPAGFGGDSEQLIGQIDEVLALHRENMAAAQAKKKNRAASRSNKRKRSR